MRNGFRPLVNPATSIRDHQGTPTEHARTLAAALQESRSAEASRIHAARIEGHLATSSYVPDQRYLATASLDGKCKVWDLNATTTTPLVLEHNAAVTAARWLPVPEAPDRLFVATACRDGIAAVLRDPQTWS